MGARVRAAYHTRPPSLPEAEGVRVDVATGDGLDAALASNPCSSSPASWPTKRPASCGWLRRRGAPA
jgi:hypothetical protein